MSLNTAHALTLILVLLTLKSSHGITTKYHLPIENHLPHGKILVFFDHGQANGDQYVRAIAPNVKHVLEIIVKDDSDPHVSYPFYWRMGDDYDDDDHRVYYGEFELLNSSIIATCERHGQNTYAWKASEFEMAFQVQHLGKQYIRRWKEGIYETFYAHYVPRLVNP